MNQRNERGRGYGGRLPVRGTDRRGGGSSHGGRGGYSALLDFTRPGVTMRRESRSGGAFSTGGDDADGKIVKPIGYKRLEEMEAKESSRNILLVLAGPRSGLEERLSGLRGTENHGMTQILLKVFAKMSESGGPTTALVHVLQLILKHSFHQHVIGFIFDLLTEESPARIRRAPLHVKNALTLMDLLLNVLPSTSRKEVSMTMLIIESVMNGLGSTLAEAREQYSLVNAKLDNLKKEETTKKKGASNSAFMDELHSQPPPNDYHDIPVFPQLSDIQENVRPFLRTNLTDKAYEDVNHYLDVQFRLLREDFIQPLREGIAEIMHYGELDKKGRKFFQSVKVYDNVRIEFMKPDPRGILHRIHFNTEELQNVRWKNTKRFLYGNLLCFSSDHFKEDVVFAVVADRQPEDLSRGYLTVQFVSDEENNGRVDGLQREDEILQSDSDSDDEMGAAMRVPARRERSGPGIDFRKIYVMVETEAYFEAYRHVLAGLKETNMIPLERYIVRCSADMQAPEYLRPSVAGTAEYNFSSVTDSPRRVEVLNYDWPSPEELRLDHTQAEALKLALTNELAIIQGPPGTGKTHVGLIIIKILLANKSVWFPGQHRVRLGRNPYGSPILVVCYTNHALDQFLEGIAKFCGEDRTIVRVGGRSKNEVTKEFSLNQIRRKRRAKGDRRGDDDAVRRRAIWELHNGLRTIEYQLQENCERLEASLHCIQRLKEIECEIPRRLYAQFATTYPMFGGGFYRPQKSPDDVLLEWLGINRIEQEVDFKLEAQNLSQVTLAVLVSLGFSLEDIGMAYHSTGNVDAIYLRAWILRHSQAPSGDGSDNEGDEEVDFVQNQRLIDAEDDFATKNQARNGRRSQSQMNQLMKQMAAITFQEIGVAGNKTADQGGWQQTKHDRKRAKENVKRQLGKTSMMTKSEEDRVININDLNLEDRWRLYRTWINRWRDQFRFGSDKRVEKYNRLARQLQEMRKLEDEEILKMADIIAVTTTGAAKYRDLIYKLNCKIVVVEEAAEVLEAHVITAMPRSTKHLVLIGDHQQLKPSPTVYELARKFNLDTSLFERLITKVPHVTLTRQHRMRPAIADLLRPHIYKHLEDDESVLFYREITGIKKPLFFVSHTVLEESVADIKSKKNQFEADFLVALCKYIIMQGYKPEQITILAMYTGQLFAFRKTMKEQICKGVRVTAVDNFQGEENDIILLSLVRSNEEARIGFLGIENRICVALSRAKRGLYCIGNMELLRSKSSLWRKINGHLEQKECVGESLILQCKHHPEKCTPVKCASDFIKVPEGGCGQPCTTRLDCGHVCTRPCHPDDHSKYRCNKTCDKTLCEKGHRCKKRCYEDCGPCSVLVSKIMTKCGHPQRIKCHESPLMTPCKMEIPVNLPCGHDALAQCHQSKSLTTSICKEKCREFLECEHSCRGSCQECFQGRLHVPCMKKCGRTLVCGHACKSNCSLCPPCEEKCRTMCEHSKCEKKCGEPCVLCQEKCAWKCSHYTCTKLCSEPCDRPPCNKPCEKKLKCGHPCIGLCGETCPRLCRICDNDKVTELFFGDEDEHEARFVELEDCGHVFTYQSLDQWMEQEESGKAIKMKECPRCKCVIWRNRRYGHIINDLLRSLNKVKTRICGTSLDLKEAKRSRLRLKFAVTRDEELRTAYPMQIDIIISQLNNEPTRLSANELPLLEERFRRLQRLGKLKEASRLSGSGKFWEAAQRDMKCILKWIELPRTHSTDEEKASFSREMKRIEDVLKFIKVETKYGQMASVSKKSVSSVVTQLENLLFETHAPYDNERKMKTQKLFQALFNKAPELTSNLGISEGEKEEICKAMGFATKGHWYACSKGHVYAIGECGGATVTATCPQCQEEIGGSSHRLVSTSRVATEMDGATRPAYDPANTYIPQNLLADLQW